MSLISEGQEQRLEPRHLNLIDWPGLMRKLEAYRRAQRLTHMHLDPSVLREVLRNGYYKLTATERQLEEPSFVQCVEISHQ